MIRRKIIFTEEMDQGSVLYKILYCILDFKYIDFSINFASQCCYELDEEKYAV